MGGQYHYPSSTLSFLHLLAKCSEVLDAIPECHEGDPQEETKDTTKLSHQGAEGVN